MNIEQKLSSLLLKTKNYRAENIRNIVDMRNLITDLA